MSKLLLALLGCLVTLHHAPISGNMLGPDSSKALDIAPPIAVKLPRNSRPVQQLTTCCYHALVRCLARMFCKCARGIGNHEHIVALLDEAEGGKRHANFSQDATMRVSFCVTLAWWYTRVDSGVRGVVTAGLT